MAAGKRDIDRMFEDAARAAPAPDKDARPKTGRGGRFDKKKVADHNRSVDLHGLTLEQALAAVDREIREARRLREPSLRIVTGKGRNSPGLHSPLLLGVGDYLDRERGTGGLTYEKKDGYFLIWFGSSSSSR